MNKDILYIVTQINKSGETLERIYKDKNTAVKIYNRLRMVHQDDVFKIDEIK